MEASGVVKEKMMEGKKEEKTEKNKAAENPQQTE